MLWMPLSAPPLSSPCSFYCLVSGRTLLDSSWLKICWQSCQWLGWLCWIGRNCSTQMAWGQPGMRTRKICSFNRSCRSSFVWTDFWSVWVLHWVWISVSRDGFWASIFRDIFIAVLPSGFWSLGASYFRVPQCASSRSQASAEVIGCEGRGYNFPAAGPHTWGQRTWVPSCSASACWSGWQVLCWRLRADSVWTDMRCCWNPRSFQLIYSNLYRQKVCDYSKADIHSQGQSIAIYLSGKCSSIRTSARSFILCSYEGSIRASVFNFFSIAYIWREVPLFFKWIMVSALSTGSASQKDWASSCRVRTTSNLIASSCCIPTSEAATGILSSTTWSRNPIPPASDRPEESCLSGPTLAVSSWDIPQKCSWKGRKMFVLSCHFPSSIASLRFTGSIPAGTPELSGLLLPLRVPRSCSCSSAEFSTFYWP